MKPTPPMSLSAQVQPLDPPLFNPPVTYPVGANPVAIARGDFTGNGILDLVVANSDDNTLSVFLGKIDGTFTGPTVYNVGSGTRPFDVAVGDFTGDGHLDIVTANNGNNSVSVFLGHGDGTFDTTPINTPLAVAPARVVVGDFNGDGKLDIATGNGGNNTVTVLFGNGNGTFFTPGVPYLTGGTVFGLAAGQLKNAFSSASVPDLVAVNTSSNAITVLLNDGHGTFTPQLPIPVGSQPFRAALGDFNKDGYLDIAVSNGSSNNVSVLLNKADGSGAFQPPVSYAVDPFPIGIAAGDFDGDGNLDLVTANNGPNNNNSGHTVSVLLGNGNGTFQSQQPISISPGIGPFALTAADFNDDGFADIAVTDAGSKQLSVLLTNRPLDVAVNTIQAVATFPFSGAVATITGAKSANDTTAIIDWGDNSFAIGTRTTNIDGTLTVNGLHTYATPGTFLLAVTVTEGSRSIAGNGQALVQPPLVLSAQNISALTGVAFSGQVAMGTFPDGVSPSIAVIDWGDSSSATVGTITPTGSGAFTVNGTHTYVNAGTFLLTVTVSDTNANGHSATDASNATVIASLTVTGLPIGSVEGTAFSGPVATGSFTGITGPFNATIDWGDSTAPSSGTVAVSGNTFTVNGSHTYTEENNYTFSVTVSDTTSQSSAIGSGTASIGDAPLTLNSLSVRATSRLAILLATFTDANSSASVSDFQASIDWGDGNITPGTIAKNVLGSSFSVSGSHTYGRAGAFTVTLTITDDGGQSVQGTRTVIIFL